MRVDARMQMLAAAVAAAVTAGLTSAAAAQTAAPYIKVVVDGSPIYLDSPPMLLNGRVLVPLRGVFERLGATVVWDPRAQAVLAQRGATSIALTIGSSQAAVNGQAQPIDTPALLVAGHTMVPLRFISQALGAAVGWDAATYTVQIDSQTAGAPPSGAPPMTAPPAGAAPAGVPPSAPQPAAQTIAGTITQLNAAAYPAQITVQVPNGTVYTFRIVSGTTITRVTGTGSNAPIPLSDLRAGDGVAVTADPSGTAQSIQALNYSPVQAPPPAATPGAGQPVAGIVTQVNASSYPGQLSVQTATGTEVAYRIVSGTVITRTNTTTGYGGPAPLTSIEPGDAVTVLADPSGTAQSIQVSFAEVTGVVAAAGNNQIALQDGQTFLLGPGAQVTQGGQPVPLAALQPGTAVTLRVNPATGQVSRVLLRQASAPGTVPTASGAPAVSVTPAGRRLAAGDVMTVTATGPPHGTATFSITGLRSGLPMIETSNQPGLYVGNYAVQPGDAAVNANVTVSITAPNGQLLTAAAPAPVSIAAAPAGSPPAYGPAPVITSPAPGKSVSMPLTVTGVAPAGSLVRVTADYSKDVIGFNWHGSLGTQTVKADPAGNWSATFTQKPPVGGPSVKIIAVVVDQTGAALSVPAIVSTTLQ